MALCSRCGEDIPGGARFCPACGSALASTEPAQQERKVVTVLFCDLVGFTARAERLDPEDIQGLLTAYQSTARREIERFGGSVERFVGDGVLAVFGIPKAHEDDPERAVRAALSLLDELAKLDLDHEEGLSARIGVNTGEVLVNPGVDSRRGDVVTGDAVNIAARLQQAGAANTVLVAETTCRATHRTIKYEGPEPLSVKGKSAPLSVWRARAAISRFGVDTSIKPATPMIGRAYELELLQGVCHRSQRESSVQLVTIIGGPGVGKSRLVAELFAHIDAQEELVFWRQGRCLPYGDGITFWALGEIVKAHAGILESDSPKESAAKLVLAVAAVIEDEGERAWFKARLTPLVGAEVSESAGQVDKEESFTAWRRFLEAVAVMGPLVVVVDDLHWADPLFIEFIEHLVDWATEVSLLLVCTSRPELYESYPGWGGGKRNSTTIALSPLNNTETAELLAALLSQAVLPTETQAALIERAGGNPLFAEEFVRMLSDRGLLSGRGQTSATTLANVEVPETVHALIAARLDTLDPVLKELLCAAAVMGKVFWLGAVVHITGQEAAVVRRALHALATKEFVRPARSSSMAGEEEYAFWHALVRDVAYAQMPRTSRATKHRAAAEWIEASAGQRLSDHAEILVEHYMTALELVEAAGVDGGRAQDLRDKTGRCLLLAGDRALTLDARRARSYYGKALGLLAEDHPERPSALLQAGVAAQWTSAYDEAERYFTAAIAAFEAARNELGQGEALEKLSRLLGRRGKESRAREVLMRAISLLEQYPPGRELAAARTSWVGDLVVASRSGEALAMCDEVLTSIEQLGLEDLAVDLLNFRGCARCDVGDLGGIDDLRRALRRGLASGWSREAAVAYNNLGDAMESLSARAALEITRAGFDFCAQRGFADIAQFIKANIARGLFEVGEWADALTAADELIGWEERHDSGAEAQNLALKATILAWSGSSEQAAAVVDRLLPIARGRDFQFLGPALSAGALVRSLTGNVADARSLVEEYRGATEDVPSGSRASTLPDVVRVAVSLEANDLAGLLRDGMAPNSPREQHALLAAEAVLVEAAGDLERSAELHRRAAAGWKDFGYVVEEGHALLGAGRCLHRLGRQNEAAVSIEGAHDIFVRLGAHVLVEQAEDLRRAAG